MLGGRLEIGNNRAERSIKPFVIGRKNWLFCNTPGGASASAVLYSMIETAKENGLNPFEYLVFVFHAMPSPGLENDPGAVEQLLPWNFVKNRDPEHFCKGPCPFYAYDIFRGKRF